ncbi:Peroxiredoxin [Bernardetia litoralis DSM 6794]|uniref:thioredoxin-dependent peroxiredoxin n=1 Tax=Bernardetia litoralis (strain ATCC 23117 / DSM 6794 / NBRC 15988 / NCIMB 1366 / Fx l1 / Sio-4) TaxID=880071 RepID=I4APE1_BERLS|nr:peroxiredoxin-like family protein [Bernardetia litoralis]AFM05826.1 Peroxiredoxin [Bernardetia litoralis DSM 6794]
MTNKPFNFSKLLFLFSLLLTFGFFSCSGDKKEHTEEHTEEAPQEVEEVVEEKVTETTTPSLTEQLETRVANFTEKADPEKIKKYNAAIEKVVASGILEKAKKEGDIAPNFTLPNATGEQVSLTDKTKNGYTIITWYRGGWCPYCNLTLAAWQDILPEIQAENIEFLAISPELPDSTLSTKDKNALEFEVLSDLGNKVAQEYGIVFPLDKSLREGYKNMGLEEYNGDASYTLPLAATYIINSKNEIVYAFLEADYRKRAEPRDVLQKVKDMK